MDVILVINSGSSSIKFAAYPAVGDAGQALITGKIAGIARSPRFSAKDTAGEQLDVGRFANVAASAQHGQLIEYLLDWFSQSLKALKIVAAGHRVVHGGQQFCEPVRINAQTLKNMRALTPLAPLHQPHNLAGVETISRRDNKVFQVACFDTSFHRTMPRIAQLFAIPRALSDEGIIRYGFHGLSYEYIAGLLPDLPGPGAGSKTIVAHLGNGASICAMKHGKSVATSMGFTALHGLMMGRRSGTLDAGAVLHLLQQKGMSVSQVHELLYRKSGLLGVSGISNNMQELQQCKDKNAAEAIELFCYRAASEFGSHITALEGINSIVFTGGIGENSAPVRANICQRLSWLGVELDKTKNDNNEQVISSLESKISVFVIKTNEELVIARSTQRLMANVQAV